MDKAWRSSSVLCFVLGASACGDGREVSERDKVEQDGANQQHGIGRYGGDCVDGAVRCTDQHGAPLCPVKTGYEGDDLAVCQPASSEDGLLLHYGPADYKDPTEIKKYTLGAFAEAENCVYVRTTNTEPVYLKRYSGRMRPYSHHLIVTMPSELPQGVVEGEPAPCNQGEAIGSRWLLGSQDPQIDLSTDGIASEAQPAVPGDPDYGLGQKVLPNSLLRLDLHYVNTTDREILREAWIYLKATPRETVVNEVDMITMFQGAINVPPNSKGVKTARGRCLVPGDRHIGMVTGHFHQNGTRFTVWHEPEGGTPVKVYETRDWDLPGNALFTPRIQNPPLDDSGVWGATSGYLAVKAGDYISFECEFDNPTDTQVSFGELGRDQMCNVFGLYYPSDGDVWNCFCAGELCL
ncbi:MAG: hypothetical protein QM778_18045 [Myxococcales bacterium]